MPIQDDLKVATQWFNASTERRDGEITVRMSGNADMTIHERLSAFLRELHTIAVAMRCEQVVFEFQDLYFMNSSCMSLLLRFIDEDQQQSRVTARFKIRLVSNPEQRWQKKSFDAMQAYAPDLVSVA